MTDTPTLIDCTDCGGEGKLLVYMPAYRQRFNCGPVDESEYLTDCETCEGRGTIEVEDAA